MGKVQGVLLVFLDFDGVLHPGLGEDCPLVHLPRFEDVMREFAFNVVLSTSWRQGSKLRTLRDLFSPDLRSRVIGMTPVIDRREPPYPIHRRYVEIQDFLRRRAPNRAWLAIDDDARNFPPGCSQLMLTDPARGLDTETMHGLRRRLAAELAGK